MHTFCEVHLSHSATTGLGRTILGSENGGQCKHFSARKFQKPAYERMVVRESTETWNHRALAVLNVLGSLRRHGDSRAGAAIPVDSVVLALLERTRVGRQTRGGTTSRACERASEYV